MDAKQLSEAFPNICFKKKIAPGIYEVHQPPMTTINLATFVGGVQVFKGPHDTRPVIYLD